MNAGVWAATKVAPVTRARRCVLENIVRREDGVGETGRRVCDTFLTFVLSRASGSGLRAKSRSARNDRFSPSASDSIFNIQRGHQTVVDARSPCRHFIKPPSQTCVDPPRAMV